MASKKIELVSINQLGNRKIPSTTSLRISEIYKIDHNYILKKIGKLIKNKEITEGTFSLSEYKDPTGRFLPMYILDNDATMAIIPSFTGIEARKITRKFYNEFIRLVKRQAREGRVIRTRFDDPAILNKLANDVLLEKRSSMGKITQAGHYIALAKWINQHAFGEVEAGQKPRTAMTPEQFQNLTRRLGVAVTGILKGAIHKKELFEYFETQGLLPIHAQALMGALDGFANDLS